MAGFSQRAAYIVTSVVNKLLARELDHENSTEDGAGGEVAAETGYGMKVCAFLFIPCFLTLLSARLDAGETSEILEKVCVIDFSFCGRAQILFWSGFCLRRCKPDWRQISAV